MNNTNMTSHHQLPTRPRHPINGTGLWQRLCFLALVVVLSSTSGQAQIPQPSLMLPSSAAGTLSLPKKNEDYGLKPTSLLKILIAEDTSHIISNTKG